MLLSPVLHEHPSHEGRTALLQLKGKRGKESSKGAKRAVFKPPPPEGAQTQQAKPLPSKSRRPMQSYVITVRFLLMFSTLLPGFLNPCLRFPHLRFVTTDLVSVANLPGDRCLPYVIKETKMVTITFPIPTTQIKLTFNEPDSVSPIFRTRILPQDSFPFLKKSSLLPTAAIALTLTEVCWEFDK